MYNKDIIREEIDETTGRAIRKLSVLQGRQTCNQCWVNKTIWLRLGNHAPALFSLLQNVSVRKMWPKVSLNIWSNKICLFFSSDSEFLNNDVESRSGRFHALSLSNLPATVAPGGMSVRLIDPHITDTKNNNQPAQQNPEQLTIHLHPKCENQLCLDAWMNKYTN